MSKFSFFSAFVLFIMVVGSATGCSDDDNANKSDAMINSDSGVANDISITPDSAPIPSRCYDKEYNQVCNALDPAPNTDSEISAYIEKNAYLLKCNQQTDLSLFNDLFANNQVFMMGEVHGSNEIGIMSDALFEYLVRNKGITTVAFEIPMDFQESFQSYVDTGMMDNTLSQIFPYYSANDFTVRLTEKARQLKLEGYPITIVPVDFSYGTETPIKKIKEVATKLNTYNATVLDSIPTTTTAFDFPTEEYIQSVQSYTDNILNQISTICTELNEDDCDTLTNMLHATWVAATVYDYNTDQEEWFERREYVIYYNLRQALKSSETKLYLHMGAFHTNKSESSAGSRIAHEYEITKNKVFSVAAAWGDGSQINYSYVMDVPADPEIIDEALSSKTTGPYFISTTYPGTDCVTNPLPNIYLDKDDFKGTMDQLYDGYIYIRQLTPDTFPDSSTLTLNKKLSFTWPFFYKRNRVWEIERRVLKNRKIRSAKR